MRTTSSRTAVAAVGIAAAGIIAVLPDGMLRWTFPKYLIVAVAVGVALFARRTGKLPTWAWVVAAAAFAALVVAAIAGSVLYGTDVWVGLVGRWPRYLGPLVALPVGAGAAWLGASLLGPRAEGVCIRAFLIAMSAAAVVIAFVGVLEAIGLRPFSSDLERPGSVFGNATDQGIVCAMMLLVLAGAAASRRVRDDAMLRIVVLLGGAGAVVGLGTSASRGAYLAALLGVIVLALLLWRTGALRGRIVAGGAAAMGLAVAIVVVFAPGALDRLTGADTVAAATVDERWTLWGWGLRVFSTSPVVGAGSGSFIDRVPSFQDASWYLDRPLNTVLESSHNWILDAASDGGVVLVGVMAVGLVLTTRTVARRLRGATDPSGLFLGSTAGLIVAVVALLAHPTGPAVFLLVAVLLGIVVGEPAPLQEGFGSVPRTIAARVAGAAVVVALAAGTAAEVPMATAAGRNVAGASPDAGFALAVTLRPWDRELVALAAQVLTTRADAGDPDASEAPEEWTARAAAAFPHTLAVLDARAVTLEAGQEWNAAADMRERMAAVAPHDIPARLDLAIDLAMAGERDRAVQVASAILEERPDIDNARLLITEICGDRTDEDCSIAAR
ncbi:hypothetical protein NS220_17835 [Microbacterium testaceum]|uniref:O-antigen ligase-related domain-containing protein n=1 Tax=Microbacterium testaceum TaxID=2033 RepID=A0A147ES60_MICTE|nr:O-antigen ligase family protein [Microbacterium testaceum]KTR87446.1 hypothetical protein NS220_17835 [Microbacterium testaceum]